MEDLVYGIGLVAESIGLLTLFVVVLCQQSKIKDLQRQIYARVNEIHKETGGAHWALTGENCYKQISLYMMICGMADYLDIRWEEPKIQQPLPTKEGGYRKKKTVRTQKRNVSAKAKKKAK